MHPPTPKKVDVLMDMQCNLETRMQDLERKHGLMLTTIDLSAKDRIRVENLETAVAEMSHAISNRLFEAEKTIKNTCDALLELKSGLNATRDDLMRKIKALAEVTEAEFRRMQDDGK